MKKLIFSLISGSLLFFACDSPINTAANFTISPAEAVLGTVVSFDATASEGAITSFEWDFGDGTNGAGQRVQHEYTTAKVFTVTLTVRDSDGGTKTSSQTVDIYRAGKKLILTKTYPAANSNPAIWIDSVYADNVQGGTVFVTIRQNNMAHSAQTETFWLTMPGDLMEYVSHSAHEQCARFVIDLLISAAPKYLFRIDDPDWQCFTISKPVMIVELKLKSYGSGSLGLEDPLGRDCLTNKKFDLESYAGNFEIITQKYYD